MANANPDRIGQVNQAGDVDAIFLKVMGGEVLTAFQQNTVMDDKQRVRKIASGKSAQFPAMGRIGASYHSPGAEIVGRNVNHAERVIVIDDLLLSDAFLANIDEAKNHYEVRSEISSQMGQELAKQYDTNSLRNVILAARSSATVTDGDGGSSLINAAYANDSAVIAAGLFASAQAFDEKDVPDTDRHAVFKPAQYYLMAQNTTLMNRDWDGRGSYAEGKIPVVADIKISKSNNLPQADDSLNTAIPAAYRGNFSTVIGAVFHSSAVGVVKLLELAMESEYDIRRQGTLMVAKYAVGHGILRPESAIELKTL